MAVIKKALGTMRSTPTTAQAAAKNLHVAGSRGAQHVAGQHQQEPETETPGPTKPTDTPLAP
jgi:hypothetical protein